MEIQLTCKSEAINIKIYRNDNQAYLLNRQILALSLTTKKASTLLTFMYSRTHVRKPAVKLCFICK